MLGGERRAQVHVQLVLLRLAGQRTVLEAVEEAAALLEQRRLLEQLRAGAWARRHLFFCCFIGKWETFVVFFE
jgi:hypothetical protein